jgi:hypothetical protein
MRSGCAEPEASVSANSRVHLSRSSMKAHYWPDWHLPGQKSSSATKQPGMGGLLRRNRA